jgi:tRNA (guanine-N(7)-)-methyltransferase
MFSSSSSSSSCGSVRNNDDIGDAIVEEADVYSEFLDGPFAIDDTDSDTAAHQQYVSKKPKWWRQKARLWIPKKTRRAIHNPEVQQYKIRMKYGEKIDDWISVFGNRNPVWFEFGFGLGDNLLRLAETNPQVNYIGAEIYKGGAGVILSRICNANQSGTYCKDYTLFDDDDKQPALVQVHQENSNSPIIQEKSNADAEVHANNIGMYQNLRIFMGDGTKLIPNIPSNSIQAILITFPDPFPKANESQWRILQIPILQEFYRILELHGRVYLATDHEDFFSWGHEQVKLFNGSATNGNLFVLLNPTPHRSIWLPVISKYEQKGWDENRTTWLACWEKR